VVALVITRFVSGVRTDKEMDTMKTFRILALGLAAALLTSLAVAEDIKAIKSGPQVGEELAGPFHPTNINGSAAGKKHCLYCENGANPVAMIFARELTPELKKLITKLDQCTDKNSDCKMGSFVVFLSDSESLNKSLESFAKDADLKKVVLAVDNPAGPKGYEVAKDADVTVVLYKNRNVKANFAYGKGGLNDKAIDSILESVPKITK
jgi:hypothetical protein